MIVLVDLEWMELAKRRLNPTQLAAIRVDEKWNIVSRFSHVIRPQDPSTADWQHVAFTGVEQKAFLKAPSAGSVFDLFEKWLQDSDQVCWWDRTPLGVYRTLCQILLKKESKMHAHVIGGKVRELIVPNATVRVNPYRIAHHIGLVTLNKEHWATNDIAVLWDLLKSRNVDQTEMLMPQNAAGEPVKRITDDTYLYDPWGNRVHRRGCEQLNGTSQIREVSAFRNLMLKKAVPCTCCSREYRKKARELTRERIEASGLNYIFLHTSEVFHVYDCSTLLGSDISRMGGTNTLGSPSLMTRRPCRICKPGPGTERRKPADVPGNQAVKARKSGNEKLAGMNRSLSAKELEAYMRFMNAKAARMEAENNRNMTEAERRDRIILTHSSYAFWSGRGYSTFHRQNCPKIIAASEIRGFSTFVEAQRCGLTPCKLCKPTRKQDISLSIPAANRFRENETPGQLDALCDGKHYLHWLEGSSYYIITPVGKWRIAVDERPVTLEHINLTSSAPNAGFHRQPRIFLSLYDVFAYIKRHDNSLLRKSGMNAEYEALEE